MKNVVFKVLLPSVLICLHACKVTDPKPKTNSGPGNISTVVGAAAGIGFLTGVSVDANNKVYLTDGAQNVVRKLDPVTGTLTVIAGIVTPPNSTDVDFYAGDGGLATAARIYVPYSVRVAASGNIYIVDTGNQAIRKVDAGTGIITTVVGLGFGNLGYSGDGGPANEAMLWDPYDLAIDADENLYIVDKDNNAIRKVDHATGIITTIAGLGPDNQGLSGDGGAAVEAKLNQPAGIAIDAAGNLYIADDMNHSIRKITASTGIITTVAGTGPDGMGYDGDGGAAISAKLSFPMRVTLDAAGNLYISDSGNSVVRKVDADSGKISTLAGMGGSSGYSGDGGLATEAKLSNPHGVAVDSDGNVYIADMGNGVVRFVKQ